MSRAGDCWTAPRNRCQIAGMSTSPVGRPVLAATTPGEAVWVLRNQTDARSSARVLAEERDAVQIEVIEREFANRLDVAGVAVLSDFGRLVGATEADQVGRDGPQPGRGQHGHQAPVQKRPGRLAVQQSTGSPSAGPSCTRGHPQRATVGIAHLCVMWFVAEIRQRTEPFIRGPHRRHARDGTRANPDAARWFRSPRRSLSERLRARTPCVLDQRRPKCCVIQHRLRAISRETSTWKSI